MNGKLDCGSMKALRVLVQALQDHVRDLTLGDACGKAEPETV